MREQLQGLKADIVVVDDCPRKPSDYKAIKMWGVMMCWAKWMIGQQQDRAYLENQDLNVIYTKFPCDDGSVWVHYDDLPPTHPFRKFYQPEGRK